MKSFDQAAQRYESFGFIQREMAGWLAEWIPAKRHGIALEAGAGTGLFTRHLLPWQGKLIATDAAASMVSQGKGGLPEADWRLAAADRLPPVSANWIFSSSFLQWADDPEALLSHWKSRLAPGGAILAGLFAEPTLHELDQVLPGCAPLQWRSPEEWKSHLRAAGFKVTRSEAAERVFVFPTALELLRTLHGVGAAPVRRVSAANLRQAIKQYNHRFSHEKGVRSTWTFYRVEVVIQESE